MPELSRLPALRFFGLLLVLLLTVGAAAQASDTAGGIWFTQLAVFLLPALLLARASNLSPGVFLRFSFKLEWPIVALVVVAAAANYLVAAGVMAFMEQVVPSHLRWVDARDVLAMEHGLRLGVIVAGLLLAAPLCEEAAFRGFMQQTLMARIGPWAGIAATSLLFSALHMDLVGFLSRFELGILFGWLLWRTGSIWAPIIAHSVNNGVATLLHLVARGVDESGAELESGVAALSLLALIFVGLAILLPVLVLLHRMTRDRPQARLETGLCPADPSLPVGFSPRASLYTSLVLFALTFLLALAVLAERAVQKEPPLDELHTLARSVNGPGPPTQGHGQSPRP